MYDLNNMHKNKQRNLLLLLLLIALSVGIYNLIQYTNSHKYEAVEITQFQGIYFNSPHPMLLLDEAFVLQDFSPYVLLVGPGQTGAHLIMEKLEEQFGTFNGKRIRLQGTLRKGDGTLVGELSQGVDALIAIEGSLTYPIQQTAPKPIELVGEVVNAKCWLSWATPRMGWMHRYCTKKSLTQGVPPILRVVQDERNVIYLVEGENSHELFAKHAGNELELKGEVYYQNGWNVLRLSDESQAALN